jgi:hypothetical protein
MQIQPVLVEKYVRSNNALIAVPNFAVCGTIIASQSRFERQTMNFLRQIVHSFFQTVKQCLRQWAKPDNHTLALSTALDLTRPRSELVLENLLLRQQLIVLKRQTNRPKLTWRDRTLLVFLASKSRTWKKALVIVQPETVLRWHYELFKRFWKRKSKPQQERGRPPLTDDLVALIKRIVKENLTWGQSEFGGSCSSWGFESARARFRSRLGRRSCATTPTRYGRAISFRRMLFSFEQCSCL